MYWLYWRTWKRLKIKRKSNRQCSLTKKSSICQESYNMSVVRMLCVRLEWIWWKNDSKREMRVAACSYVIIVVVAVVVIIAVVIVAADATTLAVAAGLYVLVSLHDRTPNSEHWICRTLLSDRYALHSTAQHSTV